MRKVLVIVLLFTCLMTVGQNKLNLVPMPVELKMGKGEFPFSDKTVIHAYTEDDIQMAAMLNSLLKELYGFALNVEPKLSNGRNYIFFSSIHAESDFPNEGYRLDIEKGKIEIASKTAAGAFYGIQTLLQLFPALNGKSQMVNKAGIPCLNITDYPRFQYRGMHLDVGRHFFPVSFIKKYIDYLAAYKYNTFHWQLTEDQGWRIEIKKYPELTKTGAWRNGTIIGRYPGKGSDNTAYGGFYTQEEIKEVVAYAAARYIDVIPEIEMPGHSSAAIAAYPWLSCFPAKPTVIPARMISQKSMDEQKNGRIKLVQETWGVFDDIFCAGKDSTFDFLGNVIDEVITLFPSKYFHIGADESPKTHWKKCPACQLRMKNEKLKDEHELQSWFVQRIERYLNSRGKTLIGWDEILEGGLAPNAIVMSWQGEKGGIAATRQKHQAIMTPGNPMYFDYAQSRNEDSVVFGSYNPIDAVYNYEPIPKELNAEEGKYVLGAQANVWTEYMGYPSKVEYMIFPRMTALSEVLWSPAAKRDWSDFERRLPWIYERLDEQKINYSRAYYDLKTTVMPAKNYDGVLWKAESKNKNARIHWSPSFMSSFRTEYKEPVFIKNSVEGMAFVLLNKDNQMLSSVTQSFFFNKATGKKITLVTGPDKKYPGDGAFTLVNGVQNEMGLSKSTEFLGFLGTDMDALIDLKTEMDISRITVHVLDQNGSWIYLPKQVEVTYIPNVDPATAQLDKFPKEIRPVDPEKDMGAKKITIESKQKCRYVKVVARNFGIIPFGNPGAGTPAWLFVDEIEVD